MYDKDRLSIEYGGDLLWKTIPNAVLYGRRHI